jgi:hypothetical protein
MYTEQITQRIALGAGIPPQTLNNAIANTDAIDMSKSKRAMFVLSIGAITGSISAWLQESAATGSGWPSNGAAGAFTQANGVGLSLTALTSSNTEYTFEVRADQLSPGKQYVRLQIKETASSNALVSVAAWADEGIHEPNSLNNATAVTTQNVVA